MSSQVTGGRLKLALLVFLYLLALGFAAVESRSPKGSPATTSSGQ
ncbi:MAG TPA: hypothetical protein VFF17_07015 [Thermoanaerobaculia bacterium]|nr:hypothetical protein [Thermoanaerobaculia bacterium]